MTSTPTPAGLPKRPTLLTLLTITRRATLMVVRAVTLVFALVHGSSIAHAQYVWRDANGTQHWSDRPPPTAVPANRLLKSPGTAPKAGEAAPAPDNPAVAPAQPASMAEREAAYTQRRKDALAAEKKAANEAREQAEQQANCQAARQNQRALDDGLRLSSYDAGGNRTIMDDEQRAELAKKTQKVLAGCK